jgi:hypothetical protein
LYGLNILNAYQLSLKDYDDIRKISNKVLASTALELLRDSLLDIEQEILPKKQIFCQAS